MVLGIKKQKLPEMPGWRFRDAIWDAEGNLSTYIAESPTGRVYFKSDFEKLDLTKPEKEQNVGGSFLLPLLQEKLQAGQPIEPEAEALLKQYAHKLPPVEPQPVTPIPPPVVPTQPEPVTKAPEESPITALLRRVYPSFGLSETDFLNDIDRRIKENPETFLEDLRLRGRTEDTVQILQMFSAETLTEEMINSFFQGQPQITPEQNLLMKALPLIVKPRTLDWAGKYFNINPGALRRELITVGRNPDTEALIRSRFPNISEQGLKDYFSADFRGFVGGQQEKWRGLPLPTFLTPAGNTATYKMTDAEWESMTPDEKDFYKFNPNTWLANKKIWTDARIAYDRLKIISEDILGIKVDPQTPLDYLVNVVNAALLVVPIKLGLVFKLAGRLTKGAHILPADIRASIKPAEDLIKRIAAIKIGAKGEVKVSPEVAERVKNIAKEPLPEVKAPTEVVKPPAVEAVGTKEPVPAKVTPIQPVQGKPAPEVTTQVKLPSGTMAEIVETEPGRIWEIRVRGEKAGELIEDFGRVKVFGGGKSFAISSRAEGFRKLEQLASEQETGILRRPATAGVKPPVLEKVTPAPEVTTLTQKDLQDLELAVGKENVEKISQRANQIIKEEGVSKAEGIESAIREEIKVPEKVTPLPKAEAGMPAGIKPPIEPPIRPTAEGVAPPAGKAANIRLNKFNEDIRPVIKDWADTHPVEVQEARRGVISDAQVRQKAEQLVSETGGDLDKLRAEWKPGTAWNAEELTAIRGALAEKTKAVLDAQKLVKGSSSTENLLKLEMAIREQAAVQETVHGLTAEAGRALRSFRQSFAEAGTDAAKMEALLRKLGKENLEKAAELLSHIDITDPLSINKLIQTLTKPTLAERVTYIYYNWLLSSPKTWIVNHLSNTAMVFYAPVRRAGAAVVEVPLAAMQGRARERFFGEVTTDVFGAMRGIPEGFRQFAYVIKNGISLEQATKWEIRREPFRGKVAAAIGLPSRIMTASDQLMKAINMRAAINAEAYRLVSKAKLVGEARIKRLAEILSDPPADLLTRADKVAERNIFRAEPGKFTQRLLGLRESVDIGGLKPLTFVMPFIKTIVNLTKFGLENSFVGFFNPKLLGNLRAKNPQAAEQVAEAILGTLGTLGVAWYAHEGKITGRPPSDRAERERFYREGKQPYSIRVGDLWINYSRLEPFNQFLTQAAMIVDAIRDREKDIPERITDAGATFLKNFTSQTYMSSISELINMLSEPERYGGRWLNRTLTAIAVPMSSASRTMTQMLDRVVRDPQNAFETIEANIPGLSKNVQAKLTALGEEIRRKSPPWFPINVTPVEETILSQELERLKYDIGFVGKTIGNIELSEKEQYEYQKLAGQYTKQDLERLMLAPDYWTASDEERNKMIARVVDKSRDWARTKMREKIWTLGTTEERITTITTALKTADNQLGNTISATPEYSHEPPNIYDVAHELDSSYKILLKGIPVGSIKNAPPSVQNWYEKEKALQDTSTLRNHALKSLNADSQKGDTFEDYFKQWQQRSQITDERELAEFDKKYPNAQLGNFSRRELETLQAYHKLTPKEQKDFLEKNPSLLSNPKTDWLKSHPKENATLVIWGEGKLLTKEAYTQAQNLIKTLDIPSNALSDFAMPPEGSIDDYFKYQDMENKNSWEAQLMLAKDPDLLKFLGRQPIDTPIASLELKVKNRKNFDKLDAFSDKDSPDYIVDDQERKRAIDAFKASNSQFVDDTRRIEAIEKGTDKIPTPDNIIKSHVDYMKLQDKEGIGSSSPEVMLYRVDNPEYDQWRQSEVWGDNALKPVDQYNIPRWRIEVKYKDLFKEHQNILDTTLDVKDQNQKVAQLFAENPAFKEAYYRVAGYQLRLPEQLVQDYTTYMLMPEKGWSKERYLKLHPEFYTEIKRIKEWKTTIDWDKIPTQQVEDKYFIYEGLSPQQKLDYRDNNHDLDAWLVLTGKVSKSISEIKRQKTLTPRQKFEEAFFAGQTEFEKSMEELRKKLGGL